MNLKNGDSTLVIFADTLTIHANTSRGFDLPNSNGFGVIAVLVEHLDATVVVISHQDVVVRINKEVLGILDLPISTHNTNTLTQRIKDLQPIATLLSYHNIPIRQKTNTTDILQLTISLSPRPKLPRKVTIRVENLNVIVARISHDIMPLLVDNSSRRER